MSSVGKRVIYAGPADGANTSPLNVEGKAVAATTPGMVVRKTAAGLVINNNATTVFGDLFLVADKDQQRTKSVDDAWTINENMVAIQPRSGEFMNVLVVTGQALIIGTPLMRAASGGALTTATTAGAAEIICYADETITTSGTELVSVRVA